MAIFPGGISSDSDLYVAVNDKFTTLTSPVLIPDTTINVVSTTGFPVSGLITIESEVISYSGVTASSFTGCVRGQDGTSAATHATPNNVELFVVAAHHNVLKDEIIATQQYINDRISLSSTPLRVVSGNVRLGTDLLVTSAQLQVNGDINVGGADRSIRNTSANSLSLGTNNSDDLTIDASGNISTENSVAIKGPRPWIDVTANGALGDGVTDDATALNAIFAAAASGSTILFPPGKIFIVGSPLALPSTDNITITGYGATIKLKNGANSDILTSTNYPSAGGGNYLKILGLTIDGNSANNTGNGSNVFYGVDNGIIKDVLVKDVEGVGIFFVSCDYWNVDSCIADNAAASGFCAYNGSNHVSFINCIAKSCAPGFLLEGYEVDGQAISTDLNILGGASIDTDTGQDGVQVFDGVEGFKIKDMYISGSDGRGINVYSQTTIALTSAHRNKDGIISNNIIKNNDSDEGIKIWDNGTANAGALGIVVTGNRCFDDQGVPTQAYGITLQNQCDYIHVLNNDVRGNATAGMLVGGGVNTNGIIGINPGYNSTLPVTAGGTGTTTSTGTGSVVLSSSPTLAGTPSISSDVLQGSNSANTYRTKYISALADSTATQIANSATPNALAMIVTDQGYCAGFALRDGFNAVTFLFGPATEFSDTAGTANKTNIYYSGGNSRFEIENKTGNNRNYSIFYFAQS